MNTLRPNSECDTTPLQRLESQSSGNSEPSSPIINDIATCATGCVNQAATLNAAAGGLAVVKGGKSNATNGNAIETRTLSLANHNNNKIEINLNGFVSSTGNNNNNNNMNSTTNSSSTTTTTDTGNSKNTSINGTRQVCERIFWDFIILGCVGLPILLFHFYGVSFKRGFFCNDDTLKHPYRKSSIRTWMLYLMGIVVPTAIMIAVEFFKANSERLDRFLHLNSERYNIFGMDLPVWLVESYKKIGPLLFGVAAGQLTTDIAKYSIGRLRPHFFAVCQPIMPDGTTCDDPINAGHYIEDFQCRAENVTPKMLKEASLSFPSGHATFAFFTMIYIVIYLQERISCSRAKLAKHFIQFLFLLLAWYTALSRVSDFKHHSTDVLGGAAVGTFYAIAVTRTLW